MPRALSDMIDHDDIYGYRCWYVFMPGGAYSGYMDHDDAVKLARETYPELDDDLK